MADGISADFVILCDAAQVQGEKLFILGGGWSQIWAKQFPAQHQMAVAAGILIPWLETNAKHQFHLQVRSEDGTCLQRGAGRVRARPPAGTGARLHAARHAGDEHEHPHREGR